jgi:ABC-type nitrate/sulfonate/bicarbonate transport system permease component
MATQTADTREQGPAVASGQTEAMQPTMLLRLAPLRVVLITIVNLSVFFLIWELIARSGAVSALVLPKFSDVLTQTYDAFARGDMWPHVIHSARNFVIGMLISIAIAVPLGLLLGASRTFDTILSPYMWTMASLPRIALIPLLILILGFGTSMQLTIIVLSAIFPIAINCWAGVKTVDPSMLRAGAVFGANKVTQYRKIVLPFTLPFVISGINQGIARGLVGMLVGELLGGGGEGLGRVLSLAADRFDIPLLYGVLILLAIMSVSAVQSMRWLERKIAPWREQRT